MLMSGTQWVEMTPAMRKHWKIIKPLFHADAAYVRLKARPSSLRSKHPA